MRFGFSCVALVLVSGCDSSSVDPGADAATDVAIEAAPQPDDISSVLDPIRQSNALPALAGAVFRGNELVAIGVAGVRKFGDPTLATIADQWHLGSDTKAMTATLI